MTTAKLEHSEVWLENVHPQWDCKGTPCTLHNRTNHHMRAFPQVWRDDRKIMERICTHGVGHPDPDDFRILNGEDSGVHGCCGCCIRPV